MFYCNNATNFHNEKEIEEKFLVLDMFFAHILSKTHAFYTDDSIYVYRNF